jgi:hypothetical protein
MIRAVFLSIIFFSSSSYANHSFNIFVKCESNATDSIIGLGATASMGDVVNLIRPRQGSTSSLVRGELVTSFNYAEVSDETEIMYDFLSLDTGVRLGIYDDFFVYIKAGFRGWF